MSKHRWSRLAPGRYSCGGWAIEGAGTKWTLFGRGGTVVRRARSKGELQQAVADGIEDTSEDPPEPRAPRAPRAAAADSTESVFALLRLELEQLTLSVRSLTAAVERLAERR